MWGNLKGVSDQVQAALKHISYEEDVWDKIEHGLMRSFYEHDDRQKEAILLLEELVEKVVPLKSRSALLCTLADTWEREGEIGKARQGFEQIIEWDASEWHVDHARGHLYEFDNLNIGQSAPQFSLPDIDGNHVDLAGYQGKVVVLHFWGTGCGFCQFIYPSLRQIAQEYSKDKVALIGISEDRDFDALRVKITEEKFTWPQICEGNGWKDTVFKLYNVGGIPREYIINQAGKIAFKLSGGGKGSGEKLEEAVRSLVDNESNAS
jgi:peroxiredoxin